MSVNRAAMQWLTLALSFAAAMALMVWPTLIAHDSAGQPLGHGRQTVLIAGLCFGLVTGAGFLQTRPFWQWSIAMLISWLTLAAMLWLALSL